jgi:hypothetical protein
MVYRTECGVKTWGEPFEHEFRLMGEPSTFTT